MKMNKKGERKTPMETTMKKVKSDFSVAFCFILPAIYAK